MMRWTRLGWITALVVLALASGAAPARGQALRVGLLVDLTGPTSEVGKQYAQGVQDAVAWKNEQGGINGKRIDLSVVDYGYKPPQAVAAYKKFIEQDNVLLINGWGTGDTEALREFVNKDKVVYISASFSGHLTDPAKTPYNFFVGASYSDQLRGFMKYVKDGWKDKSRNPRMAFIYADNPYGRAPIEAGRLYAKEIGVDLVDEQIVPSSFQDSTSQLLNMQKKDPDFAYINTTTSWVAVILRDAQKLGLKTKFGMNPYGFGELLPQIAKEAAEGTYGVIPEVPFGTEVPGMKKLVDWNAKRGGAFRDNLYVRGWAYGLVWMEAIKRAGSDVTREAIKNALETFRNVEFEGLVAPITYTKDDHRPTTQVNVYQIQAGKVVKAGQVELPRKKEWLGL